MSRYFQDPKNDPINVDLRLDCQFPVSVGVTPAQNCCTSSVDTDGDGRCDAGDKTTWTKWASLSFEMGDHHYFSYEFVSTGVADAAAFTAAAYGDLDCDTEQSTFRRMAVATSTAVKGECTARGSSAYTKIKETE